VTTSRRESARPATGRRTAIVPRRPPFAARPSATTLERPSPEAAPRPPPAHRRRPASRAPGDLRVGRASRRAPASAGRPTVPQTGDDGARPGGDVIGGVHGLDDEGNRERIAGSRLGPHEEERGPPPGELEREGLRDARGRGDGTLAAIGRDAGEPAGQGRGQRRATTGSRGDEGADRIGGRGQDRRPARRLLGRAEAEPQEGVGAQDQRVRLRRDGRELGAPEELYHPPPGIPGEVDVAPLGVAGEVGDDQDRLVLVDAAIGEDVAVGGRDDLEAAACQGRVAAPQPDDPLHPPQERRWIRRLGGDVDRLEVVLGVDDEGQVEALAVRLREAGVAVGAPLHGGPHGVAVAQEVVVSPFRSRRR